MINNKRIRDILASKQFFVLCIIWTVLIGIDLIQGILGMIDMWSGYVAIMIFSMIIGLIMPTLLCISIWLIHSSAKKDNISSGGLTCAQVYTIIRTVGTTAILALAIIAILIAAITGAGTLAHFEETGATVLVVILALLIVAILVLVTVFVIKACIETVRLTGAIKKNQQYIKLKTGAIGFMLVMSMISCVISLLGQVVNLISQGEIYAELDELQGASILLGLGSGYGALGIIITVLGIFAIIGEFAFYLISFMTVSKAKAAFNDNSIYSDNQKYNDNMNYNNNMSFNNNFESFDKNTQVLIGGSITCIRGSEVGATYSMNDGEELIIGKDPKYANIIVDSAYRQVSRKHCGIRFNAMENMYYIVDYSSNGTYLAGQPKMMKSIFVSAMRGSVVCLANDDVQFRLD